MQLKESQSVSVMVIAAVISRRFRIFWKSICMSIGVIGIKNGFVKILEAAPYINGDAKNDGADVDMRDGTVRNGRGIVVDGRETCGRAIGAGECGREISGIGDGVWKNTLVMTGFIFRLLNSPQISPQMEIPMGL